MSETERIRVGALVSALVLLVPGFLIHQSQRFPGSLIGGAVGIAAAVLMVLLLVYSLARRSAWVKAMLARHASMRALLAFHVYAGVVGALLGIIHSGHVFRSPLGIALIATMLTVVLSGFVGHYYLAQSAAEIKDQQAELATLRGQYDAVSGQIRASPKGDVLVEALDGPFVGSTSASALPKLLDAMADLEFAIAGRERLKRALSKWTALHVTSALAMYALLALHIWNGVYFGLRWLR